MRKIIIITLMVFSGFTLYGCSDDVEEQDPTQIPNDDLIELLDDPTFHTGFHLLGVSPVEDKRSIQRILDYDGTAQESDRLIWYMAQWWTPYDVTLATYRNDNNRHIYETESRTIEVDPDDNGYLRFELLGSKEYGDTSRKAGEPWPHVLIEQNLSKEVFLDDLSSLVLSLEFTVENVVNNEVDYDPGKHAAQLLWYVTMSNRVPEGQSQDDSGQNGDYLWFGIPIYDNRNDFISDSAHIDQGAAGTTNKLIYSMSSRNYLDEPIEFGKTYQIEINILPYLKDAFVYAITNNALVNAKFENMLLSYMNFGWELPGSFDVASSIRNMSIKGEFK